MTAQASTFGTNASVAFPAALIVLMTILAMLGIVANVAAG